VATDLNELIPALKRSVAVPGTFADFFPSTGDTDLAGTLGDSFAECQLDGFFATYTMIDDETITETLERSEQALVIIYATVRILQAEIKDRKTHVRYEAGSTTFEQDQGASVLVELLKEYKDRKKELRTQGRQGDAGAAFYMADAYLMRAAGIANWV
jgi:hypothetical protein